MNAWVSFALGRFQGGSAVWYVLDGSPWWAIVWAATAGALLMGAALEARGRLRN